jgi:hypothetical protein
MGTGAKERGANDVLLERDEREEREVESALGSISRCSILFVHDFVLSLTPSHEK